MKPTVLPAQASPIKQRPLQPIVHSEVTALRFALIEGGMSDIVALPSHLTLYLRRVSQAPLMSREREREVGRAIEAGQAAVVRALLETPLAARLGIYADTPRASKQVGEALVLLAAAVKSLQQARVNDELACTDRDYGIPAPALMAVVAKVRQGDHRATAARAELVEAHLRLVAAFAQQYAEAQFTKIVQMGNLALLTAACRFDYTRGERFSAYATRLIREGLREALHQAPSGTATMRASASSSKAPATFTSRWSA